MGVIISGLIGAGVYTYGSYLAQKESENKFTSQAQETISQINTNFEKYTTVLRGLHAFIETNPNINHLEFSQYIDSLNIIKNYPGFSSLNYAVEIKSEDKDKEILRLKNDINEFLKDNPALLTKVQQSIEKNSQEFGDNPLHFMIRYQAPVETSYFAFGKDLGNNQSIYESTLKTKKTGVPAKSGKLFIARNNKNEKYWSMGFRLPVFSHHKTYLGSAGVSIDFSNIIKSVIPSDKNFAFKVFDTEWSNEDISTNNMVFNSSAKGVEDSTVSDKKSQVFINNVGLDALPGFYHVNEIVVDTKKFKIVLYTNNKAAYITSNNMLVFASVLVFVVCLALWLAYITLLHSKQHAVRLADAMTIDLQHMAWYDSLTGAINRARFLLILEDRIKNQKEEPFMVLYIDMDGFKKVNDTLGHQAGDVVLKEYTDRMKDVLKDHPETSLARVGGDEFVLLIDGRQHIQKWVKMINTVTTSPFMINNYRFSLGQSIGVARYPEDGMDNETLLRKADMAMYTAKKSESEEYVIYSDFLGQSLLERNRMESDLLNSINEEELYLMFQPKMIKSENGYRIKGMEALMRWKSKEWGEVPPDKFITIAEQNGFIEELSRWLVGEVCRKIIAWKKDHNVDAVISINLSGKQFLNNHLADDVLAIIYSYGVNPASVVLEITESAIMKEPETAKKIINKFREHGLKVSMDDFGTGYSSLSYLTSFNIDELKVDKSFVRKSQKNEADRLVVEAIVLMAHKLNLRVVAEGVETPEELEFLESINCDMIQGYYFSKPLKEPDLIEFHKKNV